jgi:hypothetical protein
MPAKFPLQQKSDGEPNKLAAALVDRTNRKSLLGA